jgi:hypothetical protein
MSARAAKTSMGGAIPGAAELGQDARSTSDQSVRLIFAALMLVLLQSGAASASTNPSRVAAATSAGQLPGTTEECSHVGLILNRNAYRAIASALANPELP